MKVQELLVSIKRNNFDIMKELQVKTYLPIKEKQLIAQGIIYECTNEEDGIVKLDSVQQYLSYIKYMITRHTNLEYIEEDYDKLCSTVYKDSTLLVEILDSFGTDAKECSRILNLMIDDLMRENSIDTKIGVLLNNIQLIVGSFSEKLNNKVDGFDLKSIIPEDLDVDKINGFLNQYIK